MLVLPLMAQAITVTDYLIDADIGGYSRSYSGSCTKGAGAIAGAGHFKLDHTDYACDIRYYNETIDNGVEVQVTKHAVSDSDKWLLHEVEDGFKDNLGATYISPNPLRNINGNNIFYTWGFYDWVSNYVVVSIKFADLTGAKPEPLDVVHAYLQKFPSTIPTTIALDTAHKIQWIKDEMDRRLWLCDKWFYQLQLQKVQQGEALQAAVKNMNFFLDYREKYFGVKAANEKNLLAGYLNTNNGTKIKAKLDEYKSWWAANKGNAISF
jgi:hypothetical protein